METAPIIVGESLPLAVPKTGGREVSQAKEGFAQLLDKTIAQVNEADLKSDMAISNLQTGQAKNLHEVMIAAEEANIAIHMLVQMRNKALEAYNDIMRLQI